MANDESFVSPKRGGGSGAAAILTPSTAINDVFKTYDAQRVSKPDAYYDALGYDIKQGLEGAKGVNNLKDREAIDNLKNNVVNLQSKIYYSKQPFSKAPEAYNQYYQGKQTLIDLTSKALRDQATYEALNKEVASKDYKYDKPKSMEVIKAWYEIPIEQRPPRPELVPIDQSNYNKIFKSFGNKGHIRDDAKGAYIDGTGNQVRSVTFDENGARRDWQITVANNPNTADMRRIFALATDKAQEAAAQQQADWNTLPADVRHEMVNAEAEDMYVDAMRATLQQKSSISSAVKTKESSTGGSDNSKRTTAAYRIEFLPENGTLRRTEVLPIIGAPKVKEKSDEWIDANENLVKGTPFSIWKKEGTTDETIMIRIAQPGTGGRKAKFVDIPYNKNKENLQTVYGVGWESRPADWKAKMDNAIPSSSPQNTELDPAVWKPAWEKYAKERKNKAVAPASKAVGKKDRVPPKNEM